MRVTASPVELDRPGSWKAHQLRSEPDGAERCFYRCARPGREEMGRYAAVPDEIADRWARWISGQLRSPIIVSLLGTKDGSGASEFVYYSFYGGSDPAAEGCLSFREWLANHGLDLQEHPTIDGLGIPEVVANQIASASLDLIRQGMDVVIVDSGGAVRSRQIARRVVVLAREGAQQPEGETISGLANNEMEGVETVPPPHTDGETSDPDAAPVD